MASQQDSPSIAEAKIAVDKIVRHIHMFQGFNISEIIEAGSLGDGTVVPSKYDIDLVVYSRSFTGNDIRPPNMYRPWLSQLELHLESCPGVNIQQRGGYNNNYSIELVITMKGVPPLDVDLLISPFWADQHEFYRFLQRTPREQRMWYSVCASKWQRQFFKRQPQVVKQYISRAKAWRNNEWGKSLDGKPKSYLLQLLVVRAYESTPGGDAYGVTTQLKLLVKSENKDVYWADRQGDFYKRSDYKDLLPSRPRIVDPANPANNVWETGFARGRPRLLISRIDSIDLSRPI